ncbi:MAG: hypothetical protein L3J52_08820 [Proteobacteria bacterium]|nr:hypothetical protein [Pseudomonadota bacterium]
MHRNIEDLTKEIVDLPNSDRLKLAKILLYLDSQPTDVNDAGLLWGKEITQRVRSVENGNAVGLDFDDAVQKIRKRLPQ